MNDEPIPAPLPRFLQKRPPPQNMSGGDSPYTKIPIPGLTWAKDPASGELISESIDREEGPFPKYSLRSATGRDGSPRGLKPVIAGEGLAPSKRCWSIAPEAHPFVSLRLALASALLQQLCLHPQSQLQQQPSWGRISLPMSTPQPEKSPRVCPPSS